MRRLARPAAALLGLAAVAFLLGLGWFTHAIGRDMPPPPHTDGLVVLTGGAARVGEALRLMQAGAADRLLISGVARGTTLAELARPLGIDTDGFAGRVTMGEAARSTHGNATEAAAWAKAQDIRSLIVVTADYHMPRALLELRRALPGMRLFAAPVRPAMHGLKLIRVRAIEYAKLLAATCGVSSTYDRAVGKFVNG